MNMIFACIARDKKVKIGLDLKIFTARLLLIVGVLNVVPIAGGWHEYAKETYAKTLAHYNTYIPKLGTTIKTHMQKSSVGMGLLTSLYYSYKTTPHKAVQKTVSNIDDDSLEKIYNNRPAHVLHIPKEHLKDAQSVKKFFNEYGISPQWPAESWDEPGAEKTIAKLIEHADYAKCRQTYCGKEGRSCIEPSEVPALLTDAKTLLKSFLVTDDQELIRIAKQSKEIRDFDFNKPSLYIKKWNFNRLFTYAYMQRVIDRKKLSHVHLPRKILAIRGENDDLVVPDGNASRAEIDNYFKNYYYYLSYNKATEFIDKDLKMCLIGTCPPTINVDVNGPISSFEYVIFAATQKGSFYRMSPAAYKDLRELCLEAPFDIGYNNIFADPHNGDAIIIDTENKGESSENCISKLERYDYTYKKKD